jgi:hypothetical protein
MNGRADRQRRREEAEVRNSKWAALTPQQQLDSLDTTFGKDLGCAKQRAKIQKKIK